MTKTPAPTSEAPKSPAFQAPVFSVNQTENLPETGQLKHGKLGRDFCLLMQPTDYLKLCPKIGVGEGLSSGLFKQDIDCITDIIVWLNADGVGVLNLWVKEQSPKILTGDRGDVEPSYRPEQQYNMLKRRFIVDSHDGRHRAAAAIVLGIETVPVKVRIDGYLNASADESDLKEIEPQWNVIKDTWPSDELYFECVKELWEQTKYDKKNIIDIGGGMIGAWTTSTIRRSREAKGGD